jgi:DNA (cytosine-5)-methyltransferase 1
MKSFDNTIFDNIDKPVYANRSNRIGYIGNKSRGNRVYSPFGKSICLTKSGGGLGSKTGLYLIDGIVRRLTVNECEMLQNVPLDYTKFGIIDGKTINISDSQRYNMLGNGWTIDVISHIISHMNL